MNIATTAYEDTNSSCPFMFIKMILQKISTRYIKNAYIPQIVHYPSNKKSSDYRDPNIIHIININHISNLILHKLIHTIAITINSFDTIIKLHTITLLVWKY